MDGGGGACSGIRSLSLSAVKTASRSSLQDDGAATANDIIDVTLSWAFGMLAKHEAYFTSLS